MIGLRVSVLVCLMGLGSGCGYQFMAGGPGPVIAGGEEQARLQALRARAPKLVVEPVQNRTFEPDLEPRYTEFMRREFAASSGAKVVADERAAQLRLRSSIDSVSLPSLSFSQTSTFESRAVVNVSAVVEEIGTRKVVWRDRASASSEFFVTEDIQFNRVLQTRALEQAGELVASDLAARFLIHLETVLEAEAEQGSPGAVPVSDEGGARPPAGGETPSTNPSTVPSVPSPLEGDPPPP